MFSGATRKSPRWARRSGRAVAGDAGVPRVGIALPYPTLTFEATPKWSDG